MARVQCKDEAHDGETAWVDREDCLLVRRSVGGAYNRASRMQDSLICLACASRIIAHIEEQGGPRGHRLHNRWSISDLQSAYARFRRSRGLEPKVIVPGSTHEELETERARIREEARDDSEETDPFGLTAEEARRIRQLAGVEDPELALEPGGDPAPRSYDEMPVAHLNPEPGRPNLKPLVAMYVDHPLSAMVERWMEPKAEPSPDVPPEVAAEQARFYEAVARFEAAHPGLSPEAARVVEAFTSRPVERTPGGEALKHPTSERVVFPTVRKGRMEVSFPDLQQAPLTEAEERYLARARRQQDELNETIRQREEAAWDAALAAVTAKVGEDGLIDQHALIRLENPYRKADDE